MRHSNSCVPANNTMSKNIEKIILVVLLSFAPFLSIGQTLTYDDFTALIPYLKAQDWNKSFEESGKCLSKAPTDTSEFRAVILYIHIYSAAGLVSENKMKYKKLKKTINQFKGQKIIMSAHQVTKKEGVLNKISFAVTDTTNSAFISATNREGSSILCFEYIYFKDKINPDDFPEKSVVRCGGTLDSIEYNPNQSTIWIMRLKITDAFVRKAN